MKKKNAIKLIVTIVIIGIISIAGLAIKQRYDNMNDAYENAAKQLKQDIIQQETEKIKQISDSLQNGSKE